MRESLSGRGNYLNGCLHDKRLLAAQIKEERGRLNNPRIAEQYDDLANKLVALYSDVYEYERDHMATITRPSTINYDLLNTARKEIAFLQKQSWRMYKQMVCHHKHVNDHEPEYDYCEVCGAVNYGVGWYSDEPVEVFHTPIVARIAAPVSICQ